VGCWIEQGRAKNYFMLAHEGDPLWAAEGSVAGRVSVVAGVKHGDQAVSVAPLTTS
jgi:hypothetical protein